jgi:hypothetical protein
MDVQLWFFLSIVPTNPAAEDGRRRMRGNGRSARWPLLEASARPARGSSSPQGPSTALPYRSRGTATGGNTRVVVDPGPTALLCLGAFLGKTSIEKGFAATALRSEKIVFSRTGEEINPNPRTGDEGCRL